MGIKAKLSIPYAKWMKSKVDRWSKNAVSNQNKTLGYLIRKSKSTSFGMDHGFDQVKSYEDFKAQVPIRDYEDLKPYIERIKNGEKNVLWPGLPLYFCKTSGTTSGAKYIPLTKSSLPNHIGSAKYALLSYIAETGKGDFVNGKMIFLQGSPELETLPSGIKFGRLSGIVANHVPKYLLKNRMPSYEANCIEDWESKVDQIVKETSNENMTLISGIPSWVQMYYERLIESSGKATIKEIFPDLSLFVYGGVNFEPYQNIFNKLVGENLPSIELFPASEGFFAFQDSQKEEGLLLVVNSGIFYEFIPVNEMGKDKPERLSLKDVKLDENYALIINSNAGLWGYNLGDTIKFVSLNPPRIKVTGRIKHFTSAFGEHVIAEEVETAMSELAHQMSIQVSEFHVAPRLETQEGLPHHEWFLEYEGENLDLEKAEKILDQKIQDLNIYYLDLIEGNVLQTLKIHRVEKGSFNEYMKSQGKLGGQNKVPRLMNDRKVADFLMTCRIQ